ncbi:MAG: hypothetical protein HN936_15480, partial [Bacteroidetes bacterium]|nr:hypothetical protein [Bacteroidota bacterium]
RPSMTTVNEILTGTYEDIIYIPLESVHSTDSMSYVLKTKGKVRQIVDLGQANENYIIVVEGLEAEDEIFLTIPEGSDDWNYEGWEIFEKVKQRRIEDAARKKEESAKRRLEMEEEMKRRDEMKKFNIENLPEEQKKKIQEMMKSGGGSIQMMQGGSSGRKPVVRAGRATTAGVQS